MTAISLSGIQRLGTAFIRAIAIALLAALTLGATVENALAQPSPGSYQNGFTAACRNHGGTPKRVSTRVVKCTLTDGTVITCDFNTDPPTCTTRLVGGAIADIAVENSGLLLDDSGTATGGISTPGTVGSAQRSELIVFEDAKQR
jgi:hypothetical protein